MQGKTLALLAGTVLALCSTAFLVTAEPARGADSPVPMQGTDAGGGTGWMAHRADVRRGRGIHASPAVRASVMDLRAIDRLYAAAGRTKELPAFYRDVLVRTQNPMLRNFIYLRLARLQSAPAQPEAAIATLRQSLDENLKRAEPNVPNG